MTLTFSKKHYYYCHKEESVVSRAIVQILPVSHLYSCLQHLFSACCPTRIQTSYFITSWTTRRKRVSGPTPRSTATPSWLPRPCWPGWESHSRQRWTRRRPWWWRMGKRLAWLDLRTLLFSGTPEFCKCPKTGCSWSDQSQNWTSIQMSFELKFCVPKCHFLGTRIFPKKSGKFPGDILFLVPTQYRHSRLAFSRLVWGRETFGHSRTLPEWKLKYY